MLITFIRMRESNWTQYQNGVLDEDTWQSYRNSIVAMMGTPNGMKFWHNYVVAYDTFDPRFTSQVGDLLGTSAVKEQSNIISAFD